MIDPILSGRLEALKDNLTRVKDLQLPQVDASSWQALESDQFAPGTTIFVRDRLAGAMSDQAETQVTAIDQIAQLLQDAETQTEAKRRETLLHAWHLYTEIQKECQDFFGDCLAFIGALNFRSMKLEGLEDRIYRMADALVSECVANTVSGLDQRSPTIPFLPETLIRIAARVTSLRFQEWTIWMLPFTAHELGHLVVLTQKAHLREFVDKRMATIKDPQDKVRAVKQLHEFLADTLATYILGPAYPCALLILGLNPVSADDKTAASFAAAMRAHAVLSFLERMNNVKGSGTPYTTVLQKLRKAWDGLLAGLGAAPLSDGERTATDALVDAIWAHFEANMRPTAKYCHNLPASDRGWETASAWCEMWKKQLEVPERLSIAPEHIGPQNKLADVLNAAWQCRLHHPDDESTNKIAEAAYELANAVLLTKRAASVPQPPSEKKPAPGGQAGGRV